MSKRDKNKRAKIYTRDDGITALEPIKNIKKIIHKPEDSGICSAFERTNKLSFIPFSTSEDDAFSFSGCIADKEDQSSTTVSGIILYHITPTRWNLIYCHTSKLIGYDRDLGCDFYDEPYAVITSGLDSFVDAIIKDMDQHLMDHPDLDPAVAHAMVNTMYDLDECGAKDFTVDIYIPPHICDLTGERYIRPSGEYMKVFDNPAMDIDFVPNKKVIAALRNAIVDDLPTHDLKTSYDYYNSLIEKYTDPSISNESYQPIDPRTSVKIRTTNHPRHDRRIRRDWDRRPSFRLYS